MLVDGEHYPPVVAAAVARLRETYSVEAGIFAGGREKLRGDSEEGRAAGGSSGDGLAALAAEIGVPRLDAVEPRSTSAHEVLEVCAPRCARRAPRRSSISRTSPWSAIASGSCS